MKREVDESSDEMVIGWIGLSWIGLNRWWMRSSCIVHLGIGRYL